MSEPEVLLRVPGDRQYALAIRTALGGVAILKDLDADTLDDLRMAADEMCDCLLHQGRTVDHLEVAVYDEGDYLKVAISACYGEKKCPCEDETEITRAVLTNLRRVSDELTRKLQREPSMRELAEAMELPPEELLTLLDARHSAQTVSLDAETSDDAEAPRLETFLGRLDEGYEQVEQAQWLNWVYEQVTPMEKLLLQKRFEERLGQRETARALGVSQMQVSRMERRLLTRLRTLMTPAVQ